MRGAYAVTDAAEAALMARCHRAPSCSARPHGLARTCVLLRATPWAAR
jgi:hypothetical protein